MKGTERIKYKFNSGKRRAQRNRLDRLQRLDRTARMPALIVGWVFGLFGLAFMAAGVYFAAEYSGTYAALGGIAVCVGIAAIVAGVLLYRTIFRARRQKFSAEVLALSQEVCSELISGQI